MSNTLLNNEINYTTISAEQINTFVNEGFLIPITHYAKSHLRYPVLVSKEVWTFVIDNDPFLSDADKEKGIYVKSLDICTMLNFYMNAFYSNDNETIQFPMIRMTSNLSQEITLTCNAAINSFGRKVYIISI